MAKASQVDLETDFNSLIIPIRALATINEVTTTESSDKGSVFAYNVLVACIRALTQYNASADDSFTQTQWNAMLAELHIGTISKTETLGTSSLEQGMAQQLFDGINQHLKWPLIFANCGNDGMQFRVFAKRKPVQDKCDEVVYMLFECKDNEEVSNPNRIQLGPWRPKGGAEEESLVHVMRARHALGRLCQELKTRGLWNKGDRVDVSPFIIGDARDFYDAQETTDEMKEAMSVAAQQFFIDASLPCDNVIFTRWQPWHKSNWFNGFISQANEVRFEELGCISMYDNLEMVDLLPPHTELVQSWRMGRRNAQIGSFFVPNCGTEDHDMNPGKVGEIYASALRTGFAEALYASVRSHVLGADGRDYKCVVALESGFATLLADRFQTQLQAALAARTHKPQQAAERSMENQGIDRDYHGEPSWRMPSIVLNIPNINHLPENKETHLSQIEAYCACFLPKDEEQKTAQKSLCTDQQEGRGGNEEGTETKTDTEDLESHNRFFEQWHLRSLPIVEAPNEVVAAQKPSKKEAQLSRLLSSILRHRADKLKLQVRPDGFVLVEELLALSQLKNVTLEQIQNVVKTDEKQRYSMRKTDEKWCIRANQGHSIKSVESEELLIPVTDASAFTCCIHGTTYLAWKEIKKHGLNKMTRRHIHFSSKPFQSAETVSGMRSTSEVLIAINLSRALKDGVLFYVSDNQVLLSEGVNGVILPCYFASVIDAKTNKSLL